MSIESRRQKYMVLQFNRILHNSDNEWGIVSCITADNSGKQNVEQQQKDPEEWMQYDSIHTEFKTSQNGKAYCKNHSILFRESLISGKTIEKSKGIFIATVARKRALGGQTG